MVLLPAWPGQAQEPAYLDELQQTARQEQLAQAPMWQRLGHYRPGRLGGVRSTIDFKEFFRSPRGRDDPQAELDATLAAFFSASPIFDEAPQCRYKARYEWLREQLHFDPARLPPQPCPRYEEWAKSIDAGSASVVFASNDMNSPSSMFGHTLLRINGTGGIGRERLLAYAVSYAAQTTHDAGFAYAIKGIGGGYVGFFSVTPYYDKIKEYEDFDHRDLWEYPLKLSTSELQRMMWHLWELRGVSSSYYFFTENCSYQLLALVEAARPDLDLTSQFEGMVSYAIPLETLRRLRDAGLVEQPGYYPATARTLQNLYGQLDPLLQAWVIDYAHGRAGLDAAALAAATPQGQARALETEHQYLYLRFQDHELDRNRGLPLDRSVLVARSEIKADSAFQPVPRPAMAPDEGHESGRIGAGVRVDHGGVGGEFRLRPAYHDRLDPAGGYLPGAEIEFLDTGVLLREGGPTLADLTLIGIQTVAPRSDTLRPISWQVATGLRRYGIEGYTATGHGALGAYLEGGPGLAWMPWPSSQTFLYGLTAIEGNHDLRYSYALGAGACAGISSTLAPWLSTEVQTRWLGRAAGGAHALASFEAAAQVHLQVSDGLRFGVNGVDQGRSDLLFRLTWEHYFR